MAVVQEIEKYISEKYLTEIQLTEAAKRLSDKLNKEIERGNDFIAFTFALLLAAIKDALDIGLTAMLVGLLPIIGAIPGIFLSLFLTFFLWGKGWFLKTKIKITWWVLGFFIDNLPAVDVLPMNTLLVLYAWRNVRKRARAAEEKLEKIKELTWEEIEGLNKDISLLDAA
jgi:hypothetical protein